MGKTKKVVFFSIADKANMPYFEKLKNSLLHFHPKAELKLIGGDDLKSRLQKDPNFFYRATPVIAKELIDKYDVVIKLDADQIITGDISSLWKNKFDIAAPNNSNPREFKRYPVTVWNIHPLSYLNCGLVVMQSGAFVDHWYKLCTSPHFNYYQYREQDLMNIMIFYGTYNMVFLDGGNAFYGLASKGYWPQFKLRKTDRGEQLVLPANEEWNKEDKVIKVIHVAGGNVPNKWNFNTQFQEDVATWLNKITKEEI